MEKFKNSINGITLVTLVLTIVLNFCGAAMA